MQIYERLEKEFSGEYDKLTRTDRTVGVARLATALIGMLLLYQWIAIENSWLGWSLIPVTAVFIWLMRYHNRLDARRKMAKALAEVNRQEIDFLVAGTLPFENGDEFQDHQHAYSYDLDIFGENSLFHRLNRTGTWPGKKLLAGLLQRLLPNAAIIDNQLSVKELSEKLSFRQQLLAGASIRKDNRKMYEELIKWSAGDCAPMPFWLSLLTWISPVLFVGLLVAAQVMRDMAYLNMASSLFSINLVLSFSQFKRIKQELLRSDHVKETIGQYGELLQLIENESFKTEKLQRLQSQLTIGNSVTSLHLKRLSELFSRLDSVHNLLAVVFFSGTMLYHLHILRSLLAWKKTYAAAIPGWLDVIGEVETLSSLANFSYNNPGFAFPELNEQKEIDFKNLGHPHISAAKRICNDVAFTPQQFILLTGSNMSGKSTFLRSLGVNMVLAGVGAPVCATAARVHPMPVYVSMRLSDSLTDNESYFFAEIKRIKTITEHLADGVAFVLLDEILRGTNSDDKRSGTIAVVKKMIEKKAVGAVATHDLEVCNITADHPADLVNKCFEVEIINNDLHFDYRLRDGVCKNKSATFLMEKMGIV